MRRSRFTQEQIIGVLKEHRAGATASDLCRKHGISEATFYAWRSKCGSMEVSDAGVSRAMLVILDVLVDIGDRRSAALQASQIFSEVRVS